MSTALETDASHVPASDRIWASSEDREGVISVAQIIAEAEQGLSKSDQPQPFDYNRPPEGRKAVDSIIWALPQREFPNFAAAEAYIREMVAFVCHLPVDCRRLGLDPLTAPILNADHIVKSLLERKCFKFNDGGTVELRPVADPLLSPQS